MSKYSTDAPPRVIGPVTITQSKRDITLTLVLSSDGMRYSVRELNVIAAEITGTLLRTVRVDAAARSVLADAFDQSGLLPRVKYQKRAPISGEFLAEVRRLMRAAELMRVPPINALVDGFGVPRPTAVMWRALADVTHNNGGKES